VRGAGRAFCSGIDVTALSHGETGLGFFRDWETALRKIETLDPVVIAAIQSHCIGGGLQLALACDLRVARDDARFGITAVREGIIPGIGMWRVARHAGLGRAKRLALAADVVDAATAAAWGLVDYVVGADSFDSTVADLTQRILTMAWTSTRLTKKLTNAALETPFAEFVETYYEYQRQSTRFARTSAGDGGNTVRLALRAPPAERRAAMTARNPRPDELEPIERCSRDELAALQLERLAWSLRHAYQNVAPYRSKCDACGAHPDDFRSLGDLARFPFTTKQDLRDGYPFGLFAVPREQVVRIHASSGTTGKPTVVGYTAPDIETWASLMARLDSRRRWTARRHRPRGLRLRPVHRRVGRALRRRKLGCTVVPMSGGQTEKQVQLIVDFKPRRDHGDADLPAEHRRSLRARRDWIPVRPR
jgi:enoyl-CoA hydratase/carnithine racemase